MIYSEPTNRLPEIELGRNPPRYGRPIAVLGTRPAFYAAIFLGGALLLGAISYFMSTTATTNAVMFPDATTGQGSKAPDILSMTPAPITAPAPQALPMPTPDPSPAINIAPNP
jgi:hypothetical protein